MKQSFLKTILMAFFLCLAGYLLGQSTSVFPEDAIQPYIKNPRYWQYRGEPIPLVGGSRDDNLFQINDLKVHLDSIVAAGGNYIRNTMSGRDLDNTRAYDRDENDKFDLTKLNDQYWNKFSRFLDLTAERNMIVQIEIWDRFDHSQEYWLTDPYHPGNNINYSYTESGFDSLYPNSPNDNLQPFFFTVPAIDSNGLILAFQQAFVRKLLSISLSYNHVLYCIDNETSADVRWATYWSDFIKREAGKKQVCITEMWDDWNITNPMHYPTYEDHYHFNFVDVSQNSHVKGWDNWSHAQWVMDYISEYPKPVNSVKIYGNDIGTWAQPQFDRKADHAIQTFFRNLLGGFAAIRFHRPTSGIGLNERSQKAIRTVRMVENEVKLWDIDPHMDLLSNVDPNEAYLAAERGDCYLLYFTGAGSVNLDLSSASGEFLAKWIDPGTANWEMERVINGGELVNIDSNYQNGCLVLIQKISEP